MISLARKAAVRAAWARVPHSVKIIGGIALVALLALLLAYCAGRGDGKAAGEKANSEAEVKIVRQAGKAGDKAAADRAAETIHIDRQEQGAHDAIATAPDTPPSPAAVAHNCERLRRAGQDVARHPACR